MVVDGREWDDRRNWQRRQTFAEGEKRWDEMRLAVCDVAIVKL